MTILWQNQQNVDFNVLINVVRKIRIKDKSCYERVWNTLVSETFHAYERLKLINSVQRYLHATETIFLTA